MLDEDRAYYARRAKQELELANRARDPSAVRAHLTLAAEYRRLLEETPIRIHVSA